MLWEELVNRGRPWALTLAEHNAALFLYIALFVWAAVRCYVRPSRQSVLLVYGFLSLAVAFEYRKHGLDLVRNTTIYLFSVEYSPAGRYISQVVLLDVLPVALYVFGFLLLGASLLQRHQKAV